MDSDPKPIQLDGPGPFETPAVEGFLGLGTLADRGPAQTLRFVLSGGSELRLPIAAHAFDKLLGQFAALHEARLKAEKKDQKP